MPRCEMFLQNARRGEEISSHSYSSEIPTKHFTKTTATLWDTAKFSDAIVASSSTYTKVRLRPCFAASENLADIAAVSIFEMGSTSFEAV